MQPAIERRPSRCSRIPLDDVLIRLTHEDFEEHFEADGVNIGLGGLSMRAAVLPDIGSQLHCEFQSPADGRAISAACEVVWAEDSGPHTGEFGLRFTRLTSEAEASLRHMVGSLVDPEPDRGQEPSQVRLRLEGVGSPIVADVAEVSRGAVVLEQALPFLRIGTGVEESTGGRRGHLAAVDLRVEGGTPRLVLTVEYEDAPLLGERTLRMDPPAELLRELAEEAATTGGGAAMDTLPDTLPPADGWQDPDLEAASARVADAGEPQADPEVATTLEPAPSRLPTVVRPGESMDERAADVRAAVMSLVEGIGPRLAQLRAAWVAILARAVPVLRVGHERTLRQLRVARDRAAPLAHRVFVRSLRIGQRFVTTLRDKARGEEPRRRVQKRRTVAPPGGRRTNAPANPRASEAPRNRRRTTLLSAGAVTAVAFGAWMMSPTDPEAPPAQAAARAEAPTVAPAVAPTAPSAPAAAPASSPPDTAAAPAAPAGEPSMPRAMAEPSYRAGPMPAPSFPSLREGARPSAPPGSVPASSPYAVDVRGGPPAQAPAAGGEMSFGDADVPDARTFSLRMSQPVTRLIGERTDSGFTVTIPNSLSLSRAGPIAARHPSVERSAILNQGSTSVLTVRFVEGRRPPFRVEAHGTTLEVLIGR